MKMINTKRQAIIWDMDGVISDTQSLHAKVESELLARYSIHLSPDEITRRYAGVRTADFFNELLVAKGATGYSVNDLMSEKWKRATFLINEVKPISGALELIREAYDEGIPQAVASASGKDYVERVLTKLDVIKYFGAVITGDQVSKGKPDPEIFLKASSSINMPSDKCVVIEDGRSGMIGAKKAGMGCIGLVYDNGDYPADILVDNLNKLNINDILNC